MFREDEIKKWAEDRDLFLKSDPIKQLRKTNEEVFEALEAMMSDDPVSAMKELGDIYVTIVLASAMAGFTMTECVEQAYQKIKDRTGAVKNGVFVKDEAKSD